MPHVSGLSIYPLKSGAGNSVTGAEMVATGLADDRMFLVTDPDGRFLTARATPALLAVRVTVLGEGRYLFSAPGVPDLGIDTVPLSAPAQVSVWKAEVAALACGDEADRWISEVLGRAAHLSFFGPDSRRVSPYVAGGVVTFADATPLLVISEASLAALSDAVGRPLEMARFRPNMVVAGAEPYAEDGWARISVGGIDFEAVGPCSRCILTTRDPVTGDRTRDGEPLKTLARHRRGSDGAVYFGQNFRPLGTGRLTVGAPVTVLARKPADLASGERR